MQIALIEPAMIKSATFSEKPSWLLPPLTLAVLAGLTPPEFEITAWDDRIEAIDYDAPANLAAISVKTHTARRAYQIAAQYRRRGVPVVMGGYHPSLLPEEASQHANAVVVGEAEGLWPRVLADARRGGLRPVYRHESLNRHSEVRPDRSIFARKRYLPVAMIETGRGCPRACSFCSVATVLGSQYRPRPISEVVSEIEALRPKLVFFVDDNLTADRQHAVDLMEAVAPLKIRWVGQASLLMARDRQLLRLARASGCAGLLVGIESINPESLSQVGKRWSVDHDGPTAALTAFRDHGIAVGGSFVLGLDGDTPASLEATLEFALRERLFVALFNLLTPYPGTRQYDRLLVEGRLDRPHWWLDPEYTYGETVFTPRHFSPAAITSQHDAMFRRFYALPSVARRFLDLKANARDLWQMLVYLGMNLPANREEAARRGLSLGLAPAAGLSQGK
jgi:radical SAM superfamily enzyme YgiQ (UPF0313 family)